MEVASQQVRLGQVGKPDSVRPRVAARPSWEKPEEERIFLWLEAKLSIDPDGSELLETGLLCFF